jgi:uncharacterized protein
MAFDSKVKQDGFFNALLGYGTSRDKTVGTSFCADYITTAQARDLWIGNDVAARTVEVIPNEALRKGYSFKCGDKALCDRINARCDELGLRKALLTALTYERAYGGAAIVLGILDGSESLAEPVNFAKVQGVGWLSVLEPEEITPQKYYEDPLAEKYGHVKTYLITAGIGATARYAEIHESRVLSLHGIRVSNYRRSTGRHWWGDSVLTRAYEAIKNFGLCHHAAATLVSDFSVVTIKIKGLAEALAADKDDIIKNRAKAQELSRSVCGVTILDSEEEYGRHTNSVSGLPELLDRAEKRLAAATGLPLSILNGEMPGGLSASGDIAVRLFYDGVAAYQSDTIKPLLDKLYKLLVLSVGAEPESWQTTFAPLWQPTEKEEAETRKIIADTDAVYIQNNVLSPDIVRRSRWGGSEYSDDIYLDELEIAALEDLSDYVEPDISAEVTP